MSHSFVLRAVALALAIVACGSKSNNPQRVDGTVDTMAVDGTTSGTCGLEHASCVDHPCCSGVCALDQTCACTESGGNCTQGVQCCSGICAAGGICAPCNGAGSLCQTAANCCSGICSAKGICEAMPDAAPSCGQPGYQGNALGVGRYCTKLSDCPSTASLCAVIGNPNAHFCTKTCASASDTSCGDNATCQCTTNGCGCLPAGCSF